MLRFGKATMRSLRELARLQTITSGKARMAYTVIWYTTARENKVVRQLRRELLSNSEQRARAEATEIVREAAHNMLLSGKATSAESQRLLIAQLTAEILEEKLLSAKEAGK